jgi:hypothetical protein
MANDRPSIFERALAVVVENIIRAAIEVSEFNNLPGFGQPTATIDEP